MLPWVLLAAVLLAWSARWAPRPRLLLTGAELAPAGTPPAWLLTLALAGLVLLRHGWGFRCPGRPSRQAVLSARLRLCLVPSPLPARCAA